MQPSRSPDHRAGLDLRSTQARLLGALRAEENIFEEPSEGLFQAPPCDTVAVRWNIYGQGYFARLEEAIAFDYPATRRILGERAFAGLCRRYVSAWPPASFDIGKAGASLAAHLVTDPATRRLPFLPDLARFEWKLAEAAIAWDVAPLAWSAIRAIGAQRFAELPLVATPGSAIVRSEWPLVDLRQAKYRHDDEIDIVLEGRPAALVVWRQGLEPCWKTATEDELALVEGALSGANPVQLLLAGALGAEQDAPLRLVAALRRIVELGILAPPIEEKRR